MGQRERERDAAHSSFVVPAEQRGGTSSRISRFAGLPMWRFRAAARGHDRRAANGSGRRFCMLGRRRRSRRIARSTSGWLLDRVSFRVPIKCTAMHTPLRYRHDVAGRRGGIVRIATQVMAQVSAALDFAVQPHRNQISTKPNAKPCNANLATNHPSFRATHPGFGSSAARHRRSVIQSTRRPCQRQAPLQIRRPARAAAGRKRRATSATPSYHTVSPVM